MFAIQLLAGDIGGTKTDLAIFSVDDENISLAVEHAFSSAKYPNFENLVREFLSKSGSKVKCACFGVAGPVVRGRAKVTNLAWTVDERELSRSFDFSSVRLLNDLQATAYYVPFLKRDEYHLINEGRPEPHGSIGVIAPGTGLGEAFLVWNGKKYDSQPSEGGHCDFAPTSEFESGLLEYLKKKFKHVSYEIVCSGPGLYNIFSYLRESSPRKDTSQLMDEITNSEDPAPLITDAALSKDPECDLCSKTLEAFVSILGSEAGNLALKVLSTGGIYVGGGIPPRILSALKEGGFMQAFLNKGRMSELLGHMPVKVIMTPRAALLGAGRFGMEMINSKTVLPREEELKS